MDRVKYFQTDIAVVKSFLNGFCSKRPDDIVLLMNFLKSMDSGYDFSKAFFLEMFMERSVSKVHRKIDVV